MADERPGKEDEKEAGADEPKSLPPRGGDSEAPEIGPETEPETGKKSPLRELLKSTLVMFAVLFAIEGGIRLTYFIRNSLVDYVAMPYVMAGDYGPTPPWIDGLRMRDDDPVLFWRGRPGFDQKYVNLFTPVTSDDERREVFRRFSPSLPPTFKENPVWRVKLNSEGFRGPDFAQKKPPGTFRVVCMGDSWTFGASVDQDSTYPKQLEDALKKAHPDKKFEVLNLGIVGHSSFQGVRLLDRALAYEPDVIAVGYAMNERHWAGYAGGGPKTPLFARSEIVKLVKYAATSRKWKPQPLGDLVNASAMDLWGLESMENEAWLDEKMRGSIKDYEKNVTEIIRRTREKKAEVVLLYTEFWEDGPYGRAARRVAAHETVPLVDVSAIIAGARNKHLEESEKKLGLDPAIGAIGPDTKKVELVLRVHMDGRAAPNGVFVTGPHPELGSTVPNKVRLYDDGTNGDQIAGDGVFSRVFTVEKSKTYFYVYTTSGKEGVWEGLDIPVLRRFKVEPEFERARFHAPIDTFGKMHLYGDPWHTDAAGNGLIAAEASRAVLGLEGAKAFLRGAGAP
jgi:lysophospholipase L1-like esterase